MYEEVLNSILKHVAEMMNIEKRELSAETSLIDDLEGKSYDVSHLAIFLEAEFDTDVPYMSFCRQKTLGEMAQFVADNF